MSLSLHGSPSQGPIMAGEFRMPMWDVVISRWKCLTRLTRLIPQWSSVHIWDLAVSSYLSASCPHCALFRHLLILIGFPKKDGGNLRLGKLWNSWTPEWLDDWIIFFAPVIGFCLHRFRRMDQLMRSQEVDSVSAIIAQIPDLFLATRQLGESWRHDKTCRFTIHKLIIDGTSVGLFRLWRTIKRFSHTCCIPTAFTVFGSPRVSAAHVQTCTVVFVNTVFGWSHEPAHFVLIIGRIKP